MLVTDLEVGQKVRIMKYSDAAKTPWHAYNDSIYGIPKSIWISLAKQHVTVTCVHSRTIGIVGATSVLVWHIPIELVQSVVPATQRRGVKNKAKKKEESEL